MAVDVRMAESSGIGTYIRNVVPRVAETAPHGFTLLGDPDTIRRRGLAASGARALECEAPIYSVREQVELVRLAHGAVDLFWSPHYNFPLGWPGRLLVTVHDAFHLARAREVPGAHRRIYARIMFAALRRRADAILCDSRFTADELVRHAGVDPSRLRVVYLGVGPEWYHPVSGDTPHSRPYLLFVGNVKPHKNLRRLVQAFGSVADRIPHDLLVVGRREGFIMSERAALRDAERLGGRVRFTGTLPDDELRRHVAHAAALVLPSTYEGFGLPAVEAMAAGTPVLASTAASLPEVCGDAALYCDPCDVADIAANLHRIATDAALAADLAARGPERARGFTWERCARETREVLEAVNG